MLEVAKSAHEIWGDKVYIILSAINWDVFIADLLVSMDLVAFDLVATTGQLSRP